MTATSTSFFAAARQSRPRLRLGLRCLMAVVGVPLTVIGCTTPPADDRASPLPVAHQGAIVKAAADAGDAFDGRRFDAKLGRFDEAGRTLAVIEGQELVLTSLDDGSSTRSAIDHPVADLAFAEDGGLWLIGYNQASYWKAGASQCTAEAIGDSPSLLKVTPDRLDLSSELYIDGGGVFGERIAIDTACKVERGPKEQASATAIASLGADHQLVARRAIIEAGPKRVRPPFVEDRNGDEILKEIPVFEDQADINKISALATGDDRLIVLGTSAKASFWEIWTIAQPRLVKTGQLTSPTDRLFPIARTSKVVAGQDLIDLVSGESQPLVEAGIVKDVTDQQAWWLIAGKDGLSLRSADHLSDP